MKGLCPFHQEKTPRSRSTPPVDSGHCFGCSQGGDAIDFLMKQETLSFTEAVERLAPGRGRAAVRGAVGGGAGSMGRKSRLVAAHAEAVEFYHRALVESPDGQRRPGVPVVAGDGLGVAERFRLGWAPGRSWDALVGHLRGKGFRPEELTEAGLAGPAACAMTPSTPGCCSRSSTWPATRSPSAGACWTSTRARPKYVNTAETPIWHKGRALYALNWAKSAIVKAGVRGRGRGLHRRARLPPGRRPPGRRHLRQPALQPTTSSCWAASPRRIVLAFATDAAGEPPGGGWPSWSPPPRRRCRRTC